MNNKGFAVSIVMYSIIFLIVTILYMWLGIVRNRYLINERLRDQVMVQLNTEKELEMPAEAPTENCVWIAQDIYEGTEACYTSTIPSEPRNGDYQLESLEVKYSYTAEYKCTQTSGNVIVNNYESAYSYDSETEAYSACENNAPSCSGINKTTCIISPKYSCRVFKYVCS